MELGLAEWTVLGALGEGPTHGFAIAVLTAPGAALGRVWQLQRPRTPCRHQQDRQ